MRNGFALTVLDESPRAARSSVRMRSAVFAPPPSDEADSPKLPTLIEERPEIMSVQQNVVTDSVSMLARFFHTMLLVDGFACKVGDVELFEIMLL